MKKPQGSAGFLLTWLSKWWGSSGKRHQTYLTQNQLLQKYANPSISHIKLISLISAQKNSRKNCLQVEMLLRRTKNVRNWNIRRVTRHTNSHLEVLAFVCRNKPTLEKDYGVVQGEMEKVAKSVEGWLGDRLLRTRWNSYPSRTLGVKWPLYGLDQGKRRRVDQIRR